MADYVPKQGDIITITLEWRQPDVDIVQL